MATPNWCLVVFACLFTSCSPVLCTESDPGTGEVAAVQAISPQALHPGDVIAIRVPGHEQLASDVRIPATGTLTVPQLGRFENPAGGRLDDFADQVASRIHSQWVREAAVDISVATYGPRRAYVLGSVARPGVVEMDPFTEMTAMKAISVAGGFAPDANRQQVQLVRTNLLQPGTRHRLSLRNLDDPIAEDGDRPLQHGDLIVVDNLDQVYVMGEVTRPGPVNLQSDGTLTVLKAISSVGGFGRFAKRDRIQLIRGNQPARSVDLRRLLAGKNDAVDPSLEPGDIILVQGSDW